MKRFLLTDYKGKHTVIQDEDCLDDMDMIIGEISKEQAIIEAPHRKQLSDCYGIPAYIGNDEDIIKAYKDSLSEEGK